MSKDLDHERLLRDFSDRFHKILSAIAAKKHLAGPMPERFRPMFEQKLLDDRAIERLCADGFEACVRALAAMGAKDVTIFECNPQEHEL